MKDTDLSFLVFAKPGHRNDSKDENRQRSTPDTKAAQIDPAGSFSRLAAEKSFLTLYG